MILPCSMISSFIPCMLFLLLEPDLVLPDADEEELDALEELGEDVDALFLSLLLLLLLFELPLFLSPEDPPLALPAEDDDEDEPPDCFSFLPLIIFFNVLFF